MRLASAALVLVLVVLSGCGGDGGDTGGEGTKARETRPKLNGADRPRLADFPKPESGLTLQEIADSIPATGTKVGLATSVFKVGRNRVAFGVLDQANSFVYAPTVLYVARRPNSGKVFGPYPAPADVLVTEAPFRSKQAATEADPFAAVYQAESVELADPGRWFAMVVSKVDGQLVAASSELHVRDRTPIPDVGDKAPVVDTDTITSGGGIEGVDTRQPAAAELHETNFKDVAGKKPVALLFATPQLCQSRVCGPVVDIALQLKQRYGDRVTFIHQEVYVDNDLNKGLREPLARFGLETEPWLFTIDREGTVAARLEGSFGLKAFEKAIVAALD